MKPPLIFLLAVGIVWTLFAIWLFLSIGGVAGEIESASYAIIYWTGMLIGPLALTIGAGLLLVGKTSRLSEVLVGVGCIALTGFALYNSVIGMRRGPLEAPPVYWFYVMLLAIMLAADVAGFTVLRQAGSWQTGKR